MLYKIGDFSKIVDIPVRTLRYYNEVGVLTPSVIDDYTGYRYYSDDNILECDIIKMLKSLDFTLEEIIKNKDNLNNDIIEAKKQQISEKIYLYQLKYERLNELKNNLSHINQFVKTIKEIDQEKVLSKKYEKQETLSKVA